jgi:hypothetical protein
MSEITAPTIAHPKGTMTKSESAQLPVIIEKTLVKILVNSETMPEAPSTAKSISNHPPLTPKQTKEGLQDTENDKQAKEQQKKKHNVF